MYKIPTFNFKTFITLFFFAVIKKMYPIKFMGFNFNIENSPGSDYFAKKSVSGLVKSLGRMVSVVCHRNNMMVNDWNKMEFFVMNLNKDNHNNKIYYLHNQLEFFF